MRAHCAVLIFASVTFYPGAMRALVAVLVERSPRADAQAHALPS